MINGQSYRQQLDVFAMGGKDRRQQAVKKLIEASIETQIGLKKGLRFTTMPMAKKSVERQ
jgi:hypothetical protein